MKKIITLLCLSTFGFTQAQQAFRGKGSVEANIGTNIQDGGIGIQGSVDFGLGENFSYGFVANYLLGVDNYNGIYGNNMKPKFQDRFDAKFRVNANLSSVIGVEQLDVYPGLNIGLHNFGGHIGGRYFFTGGFGVFTEIGFPIARYGTNDKVFYHLNNQTTLSLGASFNFN